MKIDIQSPHLLLSQTLTDFVTEKVNKLSHYDNTIIEGNVCIKIEKSDTTNNKICEIRLAVPGNDLFAKRQSSTFEEAIKGTVDALHQQINKRK